MNAEELLQQARQLGATFRVEEPDTIVLRWVTPLPPDLKEAIRAHKPEILELLRREPDYVATACTCEKPIGSTGADRCGVCGLPMLCPHCDGCRGCKLRLKFPRGGDWQ